MRLGIAGKGGTGKTTIAASIIYHLASDGYAVRAIDLDTNPCLGAALGMADRKTEEVFSRGQLPEPRRSGSIELYTMEHNGHADSG